MEQGACVCAHTCVCALEECVLVLMSVHVCVCLCTHVRVCVLVLMCVLMCVCVCVCRYGAVCGVLALMEPCMVCALRSVELM